MNLCRLIC